LLLSIWLLLAAEVAGLGSRLAVAAQAVTEHNPQALLKALDLRLRLAVAAQALPISAVTVLAHLLTASYLPEEVVVPIATTAVPRLVAPVGLAEEITAQGQPGKEITAVLLISLRATHLAGVVAVLGLRALPVQVEQALRGLTALLMLAVAAGNQHRLAARQVALAVAVTARTLVSFQAIHRAQPTRVVVAGLALRAAGVAEAMAAPVL
jgi:hypothetical protein